MANNYIKRSLEPVLEKTAAEFPTVILTGPRQSGKTTLLKQLFHERYHYVSLDAPDVRVAAQEDPRGFLAMNPAPAIFDEIQNTPELLPYIKEIIDENRHRKGQFILTGSQNLLLSKAISESLAGRVGLLRLLPLTRREISGDPGKLFPWERKDDPSGKTTPLMNRIGEDFIRGSFPEIAADTARDASMWQASYIQTYLERDVRNLRQVGDLTRFQVFIRTLAARSAQLVNLSDLARDIGVAVNTLKAWLSVLEATFQIIVLRPWFGNAGKRLVKTPKIYFTDVGLMSYLTGLKDPLHAVQGPLGGQLMETAVISEIYKTFYHRGEEPRICFWRTSSGTEVDLVVEKGTNLIPIEIKLTSTPRPSFGDPIRVFQKDNDTQALPGYVVHTGDMCLPLGKGVTALPIAEL